MIAFSALLTICEGNSPVIGEFSPQRPWRGALMFCVICTWINRWVNNREAGVLRRRRTHYDVIIMIVLRVSNVIILKYITLCLYNSQVTHLLHGYIVRHRHWWWIIIFAQHNAVYHTYIHLYYFSTRNILHTYQFMSDSWTIVVRYLDDLCFSSAWINGLFDGLQFHAVAWYGMQWHVVVHDIVKY